jgi:hypothetical protein
MAEQEAPNNNVVTKPPDDRKHEDATSQELSQLVARFGAVINLIVGVGVAFLINLFANRFIGDAKYIETILRVAPYLLAGVLAAVLLGFAAGLWFYRRRPKSEELRKRVTLAYLGTLENSALNPKSGARLVFRGYAQPESSQVTQSLSEGMHTVAAPGTTVTGRA